jgi:cell volume regulation protein A
MGIALGESGIGIQFEDANVAHALGFAALVVILAEGGLTTQWQEIRPAMKLGVALATLGVAVSVTVVACAAHYLIGLDWQLAILLGAVTSPTDAAAVFSVLRRVPLPRRLTGALEAESGLNDAPTVLLVTLVSAGTALDHGVLGFAGVVVYELGLGVAGGLAIGFGGAWMMRRVALPASGLYPITASCRTATSPGPSPRAWPGWRRSGSS